MFKIVIFGLLSCVLISNLEAQIIEAHWASGIREMFGGPDATDEEIAANIDNSPFTIKVDAKKFDFDLKEELRDIKESLRKMKKQYDL